MGIKNNVSAVNLHRSYKLNEALVKELASEALRIIKKENKVELELIFLDGKSIKRFNKRYRREDRATDVLSFRIDRKEFGQKAFLGEIAISLDAALDNSKSFGTSFTDEAVLYIIHGILHLFGYDDENAEDGRRMAKEQNRILGKLKKCKNLSEVLMPR